jgi:short-subunit dehydrogenase
MSYALITGASKGIGRAIAIRLAQQKIDVLLVARTGSSLQELTTQIKKEYGVQADYFTCDLSASSSAQSIFDWCAAKHYSLSILVNNAGYGLSGAFDQYSTEENRQMLQVNMITPVELVSLFLPQLKTAERSYILNVGSSAAYQAVPFLSAYAASKSFMTGYTRGLQVELKQCNVSVTLLTPGVTRTDFPLRAGVPPKAVKAGEKISMSPEKVANAAIRAMFRGKTEVTTGLSTKLLLAFTWLLPRKWSERTAAGIYNKNDKN